MDPVPRAPLELQELCTRGPQGALGRDPLRVVVVVMLVVVMMVMVVVVLTGLSRGFPPRYARPWPVAEVAPFWVPDRDRT